VDQTLEEKGQREIH